MNEIERFEQEWLQGEYTIEEYEAEYLKYAVWQYYKAKTGTRHVVIVLDTKIEECGFPGIKRAFFKRWRSFMLKVLRDMMNPDIEFNVIDDMARRHPRYVNEFRELVFDTNGRMTQAMSLLTAYCRVRSLTPQELLSKYPFGQYVTEVDKEWVTKEYGNGFPPLDN